MPARNAGLSNHRAGKLQCVYSKWGHLENTNQSHCRTKIEKINKRRISQSALGQKQFEQINECLTVKIIDILYTLDSASNYSAIQKLKP
jgi:hypothetical protein